MARNEDSSIQKAVPTSTPGLPAGESRKIISPGERWLLITEKAYTRVQRRGFVGGDPFDDWREAEREVDARYRIDAGGVFERTEAEALAEQVRNIFGGFGLGHLGLDTILDKHRENLELLAEHNRKLMDSTSELASRQTELFQDAVNEAMETMHSFSQGRVSQDAVARQAELSVRAIENVLTYFKALTDTVTDVSPVRRQDADEK
jgi:phasin family protein